MSYPALVIANEFVKLANAQNIPITPMKLQKALYLANGISYKRIGNKLVNERFEAWDYGPVIPSVYFAFKEYGKNPIKETSQDPIYNKSGFGFIPPSNINIEDKDLDSVREAWENIKNIDPYLLSAWSHNKNSPWDKAYNASPKEVYISDADVQKYFNDFIKD